MPLSTTPRRRPCPPGPGQGLEPPLLPRLRPPRHPNLSLCPPKWTNRTPGDALTSAAVCCVHCVCVCVFCVSVECECGVCCVVLRCVVLRCVVLRCMCVYGLFVRVMCV